MTTDNDFDPVDRPKHYNTHPSGIQPIEWIENMQCPNLANASKYVARYTGKDNPLEDLRKAMWYIGREAVRRNTYDIPPAPAEIPFYRASDAKFYAYIAGETHPNVLEILILLHNADLEGSGEQYNLPAAAEALMNLTKAVELLAFPAKVVNGEDVPWAEEAARDAVAGEPAPIDLYVELSMAARDLLKTHGELLGDGLSGGGVQILIEHTGWGEKWHDLTSFRRGARNKVIATYEEHGEQEWSEFNPTAEVRIRIRRGDTPTEQ